ncbi:MAG: glucosamine-6-phosphate deaminase [Chloroflexia bacterium]|nr:glucosamine-6-phosphate deaminase [Chloroflexia bacterium]
METTEGNDTPVLTVVESYEAMSRQAADRVAATVARTPAAAITVPTGETPLGMYRELVDRVERGEVDVSQTHVFCLDEYLDVSPEAEGSLTRWLTRAFIEPARISPDHVHTLPSEAPDAEQAAARYEAEIAALGGLELAVVGLGPNGHIAFNEPGSGPDSRTRVVELTPESRDQSADYWDGKQEIPAKAITIGLGTILTARQIVLIVAGESKADILRRALEEPMTSTVPASWLRLAAERLEVIANQAAASRLRTKGIGVRG